MAFPLRTRARRLVARAADRLPARAQHGLLRLRSYLTEGPRIGLPAADRALVLAPHPDDETLACGGTATALAAAGTEVVVVVVSDGQAAKVDVPVDELGRRRRAETEAACAALGLHPPRFLGHRDGALPGAIRAVTADLEGIVAEHAPQVVLLPWFGDAHADHRAVNVALARTELSDDVEVWGGETWTPLPVTHLVDISAQIGAKRDAIACHPSAAAAFDLEAILGLNRYRSVHGLRGRGYAEAFVALTAAAHRRVVEAMEPGS